MAFIILQYDWAAVYVITTLQQWFFESARLGSTQSPRCNYSEHQQNGSILTG